MSAFMPGHLHQEVWDHTFEVVHQSFVTSVAQLVKQITCVDALLSANSMHIHISFVPPEDTEQAKAAIGLGMTLSDILSVSTYSRQTNVEDLMSSINKLSFSVPSKDQVTELMLQLDNGYIRQETLTGGSRWGNFKKSPVGLRHHVYKAHRVGFELRLGSQAANKLKMAVGLDDIFEKPSTDPSSTDPPSTDPPSTDQSPDLPDPGSSSNFLSLHEHIAAVLNTARRGTEGHAAGSVLLMANLGFFITNMLQTFTSNSPKFSLQTGMRLFKPNVAPLYSVGTNFKNIQQHRLSFGGSLPASGHVVPCPDDAETGPCSVANDPFNVAVVQNAIGDGVPMLLSGAIKDTTTGKLSRKVKGSPSFNEQSNDFFDPFFESAKIKDENKKAELKNAMWSCIAEMWSTHAGSGGNGLIYDAWNQVTLWQNRTSWKRPGSRL